jgi:hypothetical protein
MKVNKSLRSNVYCHPTHSLIITLHLNRVIQSKTSTQSIALQGFVVILDLIGDLVKNIHSRSFPRRRESSQKQLNFYNNEKSASLF